MINIAYIDRLEQEFAEDQIELLVDSTLLMQLFDETHQYYRNTRETLSRIVSNQQVAFFTTKASEENFLVRTFRVSLLRMLRKMIATGCIEEPDKRFFEAISQRGMMTNFTVHELSAVEVIDLRTEFLSTSNAQNPALAWEKICGFAMADVNKEISANTYGIGIKRFMDPVQDSIFVSADNNFTARGMTAEDYCLYRAAQLAPDSHFLFCDGPRLKLFSMIGFQADTQIFTLNESYRQRG